MLAPEGVHILASTMRGKSKRALLNHLKSVVAITSLEIAEVTEKRHDHVMRDIRNQINNLGELAEGLFTESTYTDKQGQQRPCYVLSHEGVYTLANAMRGKSKGALLNHLKSVGYDSELHIIELERKEIEFFAELGEALEPMNLTLNTQHRVLSYRLDGYIPSLNLAIEYDEEHHKHNTEKDKHRQTIIEKELGCDFVRLSELDSNAKNIGKIMAKVVDKLK
jgi:Rha family phage regulatory protein